MYSNCFILDMMGQEHLDDIYTCQTAFNGALLLIQEHYKDSKMKASRQ